MDYILIDYENVALRAIPDHPGIQCILIFAGEKQKVVSFEIAESMQVLGEKAKLIRMDGAGRNALDFLIAFYVGKLSAADPQGTFRIVSKDKGFDPLVKHLISKNVNCQRVETLATKKVPGTTLAGMVSEMGGHLEALGEKARPKKPAKLKAYIKNRIQQEDAVVDAVYAGLVGERRVEVADGKVRYLAFPGAENGKS